jgi:Ca-activated chloride channel family protein
MTFLSSWRLLLLVVPLALVAGYLVAQRSRHRVAVKFTSTDMLASVAPRRPGWQRHISAGALAGAMVLLVLGFAQPARVERTAKQRAAVILTLDTSGSMVASDVAPTRLAAAERAARNFVSALPAGVQLGLVSFSGNARVLVPATSDRATVLAAIDTLQAGGGTATAEAIALSLSTITTIPPGADGKPAPAAIVLMSDGTPTIGRAGQSPSQSVVDATGAAKQAGVPIDTIAFGTAEGTVTVQGQTVAVPSDPQAMQQIAAATGGRTFTATTADQLKSVYRQIGRVVGYDVHRHEITAWFTGIGLAIAALAALAALIWTQRMV